MQWEAAAAAAAEMDGSDVLRLLDRSDWFNIILLTSTFSILYDTLDQFLGVFANSRGG